MAILLVTYDLKQPGRNYQPLHDWLKKFTHCKKLESVWLIDTDWSCAKVRDNLTLLVDTNDVAFVARLAERDWASRNYACADWLKDPACNW